MPSQCRVLSGALQTEILMFPLFRGPKGTVVSNDLCFPGRKKLQLKATTDTRWGPMEDWFLAPYANSGDPDQPVHFIIVIDSRNEM